MKNERIPLLIFSIFALKLIAGADGDCSPTSCGPYEPEVRFPFRILNRQPEKCGFPGFDLSCDEQNQTTIQLPSSLSYIVKQILYLEQMIYIDPEFCRPNRIVGINVTDTPFASSSLMMQNNTFYNCSQNYSSRDPYVRFPCLSTGNYSVIAIPTDAVYPGYVPPNCTVMTTIVVPVVPDGNIKEALELIWFTPYCSACEREGKTCELKSDDAAHTICVDSSRRKGISRGAIYGLSIGIGVPTLICIIGLAYYVSNKVQNNVASNNQNIDPSSVANIPQPDSGTGLDGPTIESYPKTVLGESYRLPNNDSTCAICLSDYKPKDSLRTIPECKHYFHSECIDEWLKLHAICPVCRNTPECSTSVTPCSSAPLV